MKQGVGSTTSWEPRLSNYRSHVKKKKLTRRIARHFIETCNGNEFNNLRFTIVDCLNNVEGLTDDEIDDLLLPLKRSFVINIMSPCSVLM